MPIWSKVISIGHINLRHYTDVKGEEKQQNVCETLWMQGNYVRNELNVLRAYPGFECAGKKSALFYAILKNLTKKIFITKVQSPLRVHQTFLSQYLDFRVFNRFSYVPHFSAFIFRLSSVHGQTFVRSSPDIQDFDVRQNSITQNINFKVA